jgi:hypothetical protein
MEVEATSVGGRRKGMGSTPSQAALFIGGPLNLSAAIPSTVQYNSMALSREDREKIRADFSLNRLQLPNKKTTSGCTDGKHVLQAPTSH